MNKKKLKNTEWKILIYVTLLLIIGLIALYSASASNELAEFKKQIMWIAIGIPLLFLMMFIDYKILARFSLVFYIISIILLVLVLFTGKVNGASSWFNIGSFSMQPAEFAKIAVMLFLASTISSFRI
ncbi:MAG: FtsW/RodA/SpoVE family cell cycle protein [Clostridia bacterium]|nr:FtsW/RodA/SpoVE family cell cycle protein [Clostridia bacterium]